MFRFKIIQEATVSFESDNKKQVQGSQASSVFRRTVFSSQLLHSILTSIRAILMYLNKNPEQIVKLF
jgi:hypothetical protein